MRNDENIGEKVLAWTGIVLTIIGSIIWFPIKFILEYIVRLVSEVAKGIHSNIVKWLSLLGFLAIIGWIIHLLNLR